MGDTSASTVNMPASTSTVMAPILARQFCKLQAPPFHRAPSSGIPIGQTEWPVATPPTCGGLGKDLAGHPDPEWVKALLDGMRQGFRIGIQETPRCQASYCNSLSAREHSEVINMLRTSLRRGTWWDHSPLDECAHITTSSMAVIPKKAAGKWRVIATCQTPMGQV